jgi:hypothetical protein
MTTTKLRLMSLAAAALALLGACGGKVIKI